MVNHNATLNLWSRVALRTALAPRRYPAGVAETRNWVVDQGATFRDEFEWRADDEDTPGTPGELIPWPPGTVVRLQVRKKQGDPIMLEASSAGDGITLGDPGKVTIVLSPAKTSQLTSRSCRYDVEAVFAEDDVLRLTEGSVTVRPNITQAPGDPVVAR